MRAVPTKPLTLAWSLGLLLGLLACPSEDPAAAPATAAAAAKAPASTASAEAPATAKKARPSRARAASDDELVVSLRVHLLHSDELELLDTGMTRAEVEALVAGANEIWAAAKIRFALEDIVEEQALAVAAYAALVDEERSATGPKPDKGTPARQQARRRKGELRDATLPQDQRIAKGIDVYVHRALIGAGGVFSCGSRAVVFGEYRSGARGEKNIPEIFAHELGHALGLSHVPCSDDANLMMTACPQRTEQDVSLRPAQLQRARRVAATGEARVCAEGEEDED